MHTYGRRLADRAHQRTTTFRCRPLPVFALVLALVAAGCGSGQAVSPTEDAANTPVPVNAIESDVEDPAADGILTETDKTLRVADRADDEPVAGDDDFVIDLPPTDTEVLDAPEPEPLEAGSPEAAVEDIAAELDRTGTSSAAGGSEAILDRVEPLDDAPAGTVISIRDGRRINEVGEADQLDEAAALACGSVEIALTALDDGRSTRAVDLLRSAADSAAISSVGAVNDWAPLLDQSADNFDTSRPATTDVSPLLAFLTTCTQGGYEL